ncbi:histidine phosphatase family protein [Sphingobacterium faecale]|uniref:Histidine phosphatase family protein n=1 Tax=Sphingobacterium faecale TaxID=2803775 RepID=A0ABS1QYE2_9SPHI|nr:histidine phosphatase family protein [Sphingobacterium faecale]MBL1407324.1 histidine phosphatase family protein [Sphingobacterium faecale]
MKKSFYFIRHGQTDLNLKGIVQGRGVDSPLNANGLQQAEAFYDAYKGVDFDKIYTSTLLRTHQTVEPFSAKNISVEQLEGLDEISWGVYEGQEQNETIMSGFEALVQAWRNDELDVRVEKGESPNELVVRQRRAIDYMLTKTDEKKILVCMHGRALRIMLCHLTNVPVRQMDDFPHTNTALYIVDYEDGVFSISDYYNTEHLKGLL